MSELVIKNEMVLRTSSGIKRFGNIHIPVRIPLGGDGVVYYKKFDNIDTSSSAAVLWDPNLSLFPSGFKVCMVKSSKGGHVAISADDQYEIALASPVVLHPTAIENEDTLVNQAGAAATYTTVDDDPYSSSSESDYNKVSPVAPGYIGSALFEFSGASFPFLDSDVGCRVAVRVGTLNQFYSLTLDLYEDDTYISNIDVYPHPTTAIDGPVVVEGYFNPAQLSSLTGNPQIKVTMDGLNAQLFSIALYPIVADSIVSTSSWPVYPDVWTSIGGFQFTGVSQEGIEDSVDRLSNSERDIVQVSFIVDPDEDEQIADVEILAVA